ncbi:type VI secretion system tube protein TssD [Brenneria salicis]|uniref:type VI secretion system tube protein TssD n=1 Tax=Brenneria salicis TaxID=55214 RepID=UPI001F0BD29E|nr:type VI secretion system tube protein TssD [Brenneria salicis]
MDKSSPLLAMALSNHEVLQCEFAFYRISETGGMEKYFVIKLRDARIVELKLSAPHSMTQNEMPPQESVSFKYAWAVLTNAAEKNPPRPAKQRG